IAIGKVLDDGTTQLSTYEYNPIGGVSRHADPVGRTLIYNYDANNIDLLEVRRVNGPTTELLVGYTYNSQHKPLSVTDAAGQTTVFTYNSAGRVLTVIAPPGGGLIEAQRTTTYSYYPNDAPLGAGRLQTVTGPS